MVGADEFVALNWKRVYGLRLRVSVIGRGEPGRIVGAASLLLHYNPSKHFSSTIKYGVPGILPRNSTADGLVGTAVVNRPL